MTYSGYAMSADDKDIKIILNGLETTVVSSLSHDEESPGSNQFWYRIEYGVDVDALPAPTVPRHLESTCGVDIHGPSEFFRNLRSYLYARMKDLQESISTTRIDPTKPYLQRYVEWMNWQLSTRSQGLSSTPNKQPRSKIEQQGFLGEFFVRVADSALDVLQGKIDMVQFLFQTDLAERFYEQHSLGSICYDKLGIYLQELSLKNPSLDFLEVGAGTGSFTKHILGALSFGTSDSNERYGNYCFTDVSPAFFERARHRFAKHTTKMTFAVLDAEQDPHEQSFQEQSFDVIAASNVLHVTQDLGKTLRGLRKLLRPGGKLLLHEYVQPERVDVGFVFGLLPGWWPLHDSNRIMGPLQSETEWDKILRQNGFHGIGFAIPDFTDPDSHLMSIMCATADFDRKSEDPRAEIIIAIQGESRSQVALAGELATRLSSGGRYHPKIFQVGDAIDEIPSAAAVVTLFDLENTFLFNIGERYYESLRSILMSASKTLWVSRGGGETPAPSAGLINGFAKVFRIENMNCKLATLALDKAPGSSIDDTDLIISALDPLLQLSSLGQPEDYVVRKGQLHVSRIIEDHSFKETMRQKLSMETCNTRSVDDAKPFRVAFEVVSGQTNAKMTKLCLQPDGPGPDEVDIEIDAVGLDTHDLSAFVRNTTKEVVGVGCSGRVVAAGTFAPFAVGDRVCAYGADMLCSTVRTDHRLVARFPETLPFEDASLLPRDYLIANYVVQQALAGAHHVFIVRGGHTSIGAAILHVLTKSHVKVFATVLETRQKVALQTSFGNLVVCLDELLVESISPALPLGAGTVFDLMDTDPADVFDCVATLGQVFKLQSGSRSNHHSRTSLHIPASGTFRLLYVDDIVREQFKLLQMPFSILQPHGWVGEAADEVEGVGARDKALELCSGTEAMKKVDLSSLDTIILPETKMEPAQRAVIQFFGTQDIQVCEGTAAELDCCLLCEDPRTDHS
jgi:NADPH:quinone reductase-like Zn-dependent oxidoreductase/SAM-dependent methyltransferase